MRFRERSADLELPLASLQGLAQDLEMPRDIRDRADELAASTARLQRDLVQRATFREQMDV